MNCRAGRGTPQSESLEPLPAANAPVRHGAQYGSRPVWRAPAGFDGRPTAVSPSIDSQRLPKVGMDMFRLCRLDGHVLLIEEMNKVTGDRQIAISNFRCVPGGLQMGTERSQARMN